MQARSGRPTWILLPYRPDYRWLLDRDDSPWYPSVRLFRQDESRDYARVIDRVRAELQASGRGVQALGHMVRDALLTMRVSDLILRSIAKRCVSMDEALKSKLP